MAQILIHKENGEVTGWEVKYLPMPDGTMREYKRPGYRGLLDLMREWEADCKMMEWELFGQPLSEACPGLGW